MIVPLEKPGTPEELVHFGVKGMKWGVRNERLSTGHRFVRGHLATTTPKPKIVGIERFDPEIQPALKSISGKMRKSYGFNMDEFIPFQTNTGIKKFLFGSSSTLAYVYLNNNGNRIYVKNDKSLKATIAQCQNVGWFPKTKPEHQIQSLITHESSHAMFHTWNSPNYKTYEKYRKNAWQKASEQAIKDGTIKESHDKKLFGLTVKKADNISPLFNHISGYARYSMWYEEGEAEMFSAYHYGTNPPKFVDSYWTEMHRQMGKRVQPFSGRKVSHAKST